MQTAAVLSECLPGNTANHLYMIMMHEKDKPLQLYQSISDDPVPTALGILTRKPLPHVLVSKYTCDFMHDSVLLLIIRFLNSLCTMVTRRCVLSWSTITNQWTLLTMSYQS